MLIDVHIVQPEVFVELGITGSFIFLVESGGFDLAQLDLVFQCLVGILLCKGQGRLHTFLGQQLVQRALNFGGNFIAHRCTFLSDLDFVSSSIMDR